MGNVHGRVEGRNPTADALLIGSHLVMLHTLLRFTIISILPVLFDMLTQV